MNFFYLQILLYAFLIYEMCLIHEQKFNIHGGRRNNKLNCKHRIQTIIDMHIFCKNNYYLLRKCSFVFMIIFFYNISCSTNSIKFETGSVYRIVTLFFFNLIIIFLASLNILLYSLYNILLYFQQIVHQRDVKEFLLTIQIIIFSEK